LKKIFKEGKKVADLAVFLPQLMGYCSLGSASRWSLLALQGEADSMAFKA